MKEEEPADKTLNIYWSIDNPEGASFVLSKESSYTETFAWADRDHDILLPEVEVEDGYRRMQIQKASIQKKTDISLKQKMAVSSL